MFTCSFKHINFNGLKLNIHFKLDTHCLILFSFILAITAGCGADGLGCGKREVLKKMINGGKKWMEKFDQNMKRFLIEKLDQELKRRRKRSSNEEEEI